MSIRRQIVGLYLQVFVPVALAIGLAAVLILTGADQWWGTTLVAGVGVIATVSTFAPSGLLRFGLQPLAAKWFAAVGWSIVAAIAVQTAAAVSGAAVLVAAAGWSWLLPLVVMEAATIAIGILALREGDPPRPRRQGLLMIAFALLPPVVAGGAGVAVGLQHGRADAPSVAALVGWLAAIVLWCGVLGQARRASTGVTPLGELERSRFMGIATTVWLAVVIATAVLATAEFLGPEAPVAVVLIVSAVVAAAFIGRAPLLRFIAHTMDPDRLKERAAATTVRATPLLAARDALRSAFGDPQLQLLWFDEQQWRDADGVPIVLGADAVRLEYGTVELAVVTVAADGPAVRWVTDSLRELMERTQLEVELRLSEAQLGEERGRTSAAVEAERKRLERNLHDGLQGRLLAIALRLRHTDVVEPSDAQRVDETVDGLRAAIDELRALVGDPVAGLRSTTSPVPPTAARRRSTANSNGTSRA